MSAISVQNLWKEYGDQIVLENISLEVPENSFVSLVGPSGCGKSTFLRMLLSQERPTKGDILMDGQPLPLEPEEERGVVFQKYSVFPHLTALENVMLGMELEKAPFLGRLFGPARRTAQDEAMQYLEGVGLIDARDKYPSQLSGGMQQRLAIAQTLVKKPSVLLLDEPFGALDPGIRSDIHDLMLDIWWREKMTVFMVSHDLKEAFYLGTRVIAFERPNRPASDQNRYGAKIAFDVSLDPAGPIKDKIREQWEAADQDTQSHRFIEDTLHTIAAQDDLRAIPQKGQDDLPQSNQESA